MTGQNTIEVNDDQLVREATAALATAPADEFGADEGQPGLMPGAVEIAPPSSWGPLVHGLGPTCRVLVFPQWNIAPELGAEFADSLAQSLDMLFPGGLEGKYAPFARCIAAGAGIVGTAWLANGGKLPPLGPKRAATVDEESATGEGASAGAGEANRKAA